MNFPAKPPSKPEVPAIHPEALPFLPDSQEIEHAPIPRVARLTTLILLCLLCFLVLWACVSDVDIVVSAPGKIVSSGKELTIAPLNDAVIKSIDVKVGQVVQPNETLVTLDPTFTTANLAQIRFRQTRSLLVLSRLRSELDNHPFIASREAPAEEIALQRNILKDRTDEYLSRLGSYAAKISECEGNITSLEKQAAITQHQEQIGKEILQMRSKVYEQGVDSKLSFLDAQNTVANLASQNERIRKELAATRKLLVQIGAEKDAFISQRRGGLSQEIAEAEKDLANTNEEYAKATRLSELTTLSSPVKAMVLDVMKFPSSSVVKTGESIMILAPMQTPLEAEVNIEPRDIGFVRPDDPASIKLEAFPYHRHGIIYGKLRSVGEDSLAKQTAGQGSAMYYPARVALSDMSNLRNLPGDFRLMPGMTLEASITVGQRKVITYLLYPILRVLDDSIRER